MTRVKIRCIDGKWTLEAKGHAGYDEHGKDIVCSACSTLCYALAQYICEVEAEGGCLEISLDFPKSNDGRCKMSVLPCSWAEDRIAGAFGTAIAGFQLLTTNYPDHVRFDWGSD